MRESYIELLFLRYLQSDNFAFLHLGDWIPLEDYYDFLEKFVSGAFAEYDMEVSPQKYIVFAINLMEKIEGSLIVDRGDDYAGRYFKYRRVTPDPIPQFLNSNEAHQNIEALGGLTSAFERALKKIDSELENPIDSHPKGDDIGAMDALSSEIPASDRTVHLDHNQSLIIETPLSELIDLVEPENAIGEEGGLRELILGKLRSGRELIHAGVFTIQSLQLTLIVGLKMLVEKHKDTAISAAATKLLDLLFAQVGTD